jgi:hypothetical protein
MECCTVDDRWRRPFVSARRLANLYITDFLQNRKPYNIHPLLPLSDTSRVLEAQLFSTSVYSPWIKTSDTKLLVYAIFEVPTSRRCQGISRQSWWKSLPNPEFRQWCRDLPIRVCTIGISKVESEFHPLSGAIKSYCELLQPLGIAMVILIFRLKATSQDDIPREIARNIHLPISALSLSLYFLTTSGRVRIVESMQVPALI